MSIDNIDFFTLLKNEESLDPVNWDELKTLGHQMVDVMLDFLKNQRQYPAWKKPTENVKSFLTEALPQKPEKQKEIFSDFVNNILPYSKGNVHPRYWAWVEGGGTPLGMLADMLASGMNPNLGIGDHAAIYVELQVLNWIKEFLGFPQHVSGILVSGGSVANFTGLTVARNSINEEIRTKGLFEAKSRLTIYGSTETHSCI